MRRTRRTVPRVVSDDDESSSSTSDSGTSSPNLPRTRNTRANRTVFSESSSSSSDSPIPRPRRAISRTITAVSETSSESSSEDDDEVAVEEISGSHMEIDPPESEDEIPATKKTKPVLPALVTSSDSDDPAAEPCPICLRKLTTQETGTPESCDHSFCLTCLQEWAKNVNTCPVDRQQFSKILVRKTGSDKILRYIQVENVEPVEDIVDDPTACEICGASDREDRLMLCDACNRGYHLECMTPPLDRVPLDEWYCPDCNENLLLSDEVDEEDEEDEWSINITRNSVTARYAGGSGLQTRRARLMPRTRQSERIMSLLGHPTPAARNAARASEASGSGLNSSMESNGGREPGSLRRATAGGDSSSSRQATQRQATATRGGGGGRKRRRKRKRNGGAFRIKVIQTEEGVIEVSLPRKKRKKRKNKRRRTAGGAGAVAKTAKDRLAKRLGICARKHGATKQTPPALSGTQQLSVNRHSAGIPQLDLFGNRNQLHDLLSGSENEDFDEEGGGGGGLFGGSVSVGIASRHRLTISASTMSRRKAALVFSGRRRHARPAATATAPAAAAPANLLDSILEDQAKWHSRNSEIIHNVSDGSLTVKVPEKQKVDVRNETAKVNETPLYPGGNNQRFNYNYQPRDGAASGTANNSRSVDNSPAGSSSSMNRSFPGSFPQSRSEFSSNYGIGISPFTGSAPIRFRMTAPPRKPTMIIPPLEQPPMPDASLFQNDSPSNSSHEDEEVDIYSDIEPDGGGGGGAEADEKNFGTLEPPPEPPAILMNIGGEDNGAASDDEGLVIDDRPPPPPLPPPLPPPTDNMYDPAEPCDSNSSSSSDDAGPSKIPYPPLPKTSKPPPPEPAAADESLTHPNYGMCPTIGLVPSDSDDEDGDCPNFSMYSSASMTLAQKEDRLNDDEDDEVPISSSSENLFGIMPDIPLPADEPDKKPKEPKKADDNESDEGEVDDEEEAEKVEDDIEKQLTDLELKTFDQNTMDIPIPADMKEADIPIPAELNNDEIPVPEVKDGEAEEVETCEKDKSEGGESEKASVREGDDEGSTQDVLDLAIESEANLQDAQDENDDATSISTVDKESKEKQIDAGEKPDGLIDITDEEMSVYDGQDIDKGASEATESKDGAENAEHDVFESDDDNSLIGGATSAVSGGTLNNSDNPQVSSLPGLEGLETETISESEDVNFDELPEGVPPEDEYSTSKKKKKKKSKKSNCISETDESVLLGLKGQLMDMLEFEEGEIIEDKPKQSSKKDKKAKSKHDKDVAEKEKEPSSTKSKTPPIDKDSDKKQKKKKDKKDSGKDKAGESSSKSKDSKFKEKTAKVGDGDENVSWKKLSKSTKERNYRDGKEKEEKSKAPAPEPAKKEKKKEKRKELERYDVRRLISERPKRPKKDEFGRDISPSPSESLSPPRHRNRSPLRVRNRSRSPWRSRSRSRGRRRTRTPPRPPRQRTRSRSRDRRVSSRDRKRGGARRSRTRSRDRARPKSKERERPPPPPSKAAKKKPPRNDSRSKKKSKSRTPPPRPAKRVSRSYSKSWSPSWSRSFSSPSRSRSPSPLSRSVSRSWSRDRASLAAPHHNPHKNLTVIVTNKDAMRKKDKKKTTKKAKDQDKQRKRRRGQSPAPSKEVFTSGDNILVSVNFKSNRGTAELVPATTPVLRESSKRKRDDVDPITGRKKKDKNSKENVPARSKKSQLSKSTRLLRLNETVKNAKPVAVIDLDMSPFREQTPSPKEVIILTDSGGEDNDKQHNDLEKQLERMGEGGQPQPESPATHSFLMTSTGPKTPPEPHIKFSIVSNKPQLRALNNPLMECDDEMRQDEEGADEEMMGHKGPNTPPEPPPELNTPASPPTTPYDPFDPTKSRSPSPQPHADSDLPPNKEDKSADNLNASLQSDIEEHAVRLLEHRTLTPPMDADELKKTPEPLKSLSTPKPEQSSEPSPKHQSPSGGVDQSKIADDNLLKPFQKLLSSQSKVDISVHKSPDKGMTTVIISQQGQQMKSSSLPTKQITTSTTSKTLQITASSKKPAGPAPYNPLQSLNASKSARAQQNGNDASDDILELDVGSPYSPGSSEGDDLFDPPAMTPPRTAVPAKPSKRGKSKLDLLFGAAAATKSSRHKHSSKAAKKASKTKTTKGTGKKEVNVKLDEDQLKILDDLPSSAVEMQFLKKLNRQERVVEEVKLVLKPHYAKKHIGKEEYKEILRRAVPKICHNRSGEINPMKIQFLVEAYVRKFRKNAGTAGGGAPAPGAGGGKKKAGGGASAGGGGSGGVPLSISIPPKPKIQKTLWS
ncbi:hypothetical protein LSTR_LSTR011375 [Laodelphax striatellus]|uniref:PHD and RING finger domain-containing protein 1 n=1 Tax=Laodelphax striatellus TaxID=195883 RepID=A0A482XR20_LAOST|nr:hypothetical protein LSTR_LSTR011375 [Laodelphax striatellus]